MYDNLHRGSSRLVHIQQFNAAVPADQPHVPCLQVGFDKNNQFAQDQQLVEKLHTNACISNTMGDVLLICRLVARCLFWGNCGRLGISWCRCSVSIMAISPVTETLTMPKCPCWFNQFKFFLSCLGIIGLPVFYGDPHWQKCSLIRRP